MAKFYLQSGSAKLILDAEDSDRASLWFVHRVMESISSVYDDPSLGDSQKLDSAIVESLLDLGPSIAVSELGFDREDAEQLETFDVVMYWHQLMMAMSRLDQQL
ncbi:MAG: hypothetical protein SGI77_00840 [Pirellulaceae bacterium]|nr:hypothetical protein [Pirellulaceae bacterium]